MVKNILKKSLYLKQLARGFRLKYYQPEWSRIISADKGLWDKALNSDIESNILIATSIGGYLPGVTLESLLAVALTLRKSKVHILLCDKVLPACLDCTLGISVSEQELAHFGPQKSLCNSCFRYSDNTYKALGLKVHYYSEFLTKEDLELAASISGSVNLSEIENYVLNGLAVGEHAMAGALRFYARATMANERYSEAVLRRYLEAALLTIFAIENMVRKNEFDCAVFHHGIYVPQGLIGEVLRSHKIRVVNWNPAYRKSCFIFSHNNTYHRTLLAEPTEKWENMRWDKIIEKELLDYLKSRWHGTKDWIWFHEKPRFDIKNIEKELSIDFSKPCIGLLTNVLWDAKLHYETNVFANMVDWVIQTIEYFQKRPDLQLIIRVHPAEIRGTVPSRQPIEKEIKSAFPKLANNIFVIPASSNISTYILMEKCDSVIIFGTKSGVELTSMGIPVIVAGEAWIKNKGVTFDPKNIDEYFKLLDNLPFKKNMDNEKLKRAYRYAYHFFFRRMIPVNKIKKISNNLDRFLGIIYKMRANNLKEFLPGKDKGLDVICNGIIHGNDFIYHAEENSIDFNHDKDLKCKFACMAP